LRKYGVRFGAYHIYLPGLLKPAPRALATQLWALKHESPDAKGVGELLHLAASGRTSIPVDNETPKPLYRTAGYRITGERAVRVDILERLADLIRPVLAWRETSPGVKPDGAVDGRGFTVTGAMTSLTGASGEDFASILRSLGYRMDRRPKPAEVKPAEPAAVISEETPAPAEAQAEASVETPAPETAEPQPAPSADAYLSVVPDAEVTVQVDEPATVEPAPLETAAEPQPAQAETAAAEAAPAIEAAVEAKPVEEPAMIEVWRPAGRSEKRPARARRPQRPRQTSMEAAPATDAATSTDGAAAGIAVSQAAPAPDAHPPREDGKEGPDRQQRRDRHERQQRVERQAKSFGQRNERQPGRPSRGDRPRRDKGDRVERAERDQYYAKPHGSTSDRRDKQPDPNSPFAKLAALKQQLEQNTKERP
jgi:ATP-dependent RNA helicase SUPV3L1/SUV3